MSSDGIRMSSIELKLDNFMPPIKSNTIMPNMSPDIFEKLDKIRKVK